MASTLLPLFESGSCPLHKQSGNGYIALGDGVTSFGAHIINWRQPTGVARFFFGNFFFFFFLSLTLTNRFIIVIVIVHPSLNQSPNPHPCR
jgi:hypothetical protein